MPRPLSVLTQGDGCTIHVWLGGGGLLRILWSDLYSLNLYHSSHTSQDQPIRYVLWAVQKGSEGRELNSEEEKKYKNTVKKKDVGSGLKGERPREINSPSITRGTKWKDLSLQQGSRN